MPHIDETTAPVTGQIHVTITCETDEEANAARARYLENYCPLGYGTRFYKTDRSTPGKVVISGYRSKSSD